MKMFDFKERIAMKYGIFTSDRDFAYRVIQTYIKGYDNDQITKVINNEHLIKVELADGTEYQWYYPSENQRGIKINIVLIDIDTCSLDLIQNVITYCSVDNAYEVLTHDYVKYDLDTLLDRLMKIRAIKGNLTDIGVIDDECVWQNIMSINIGGDESLILGLPI